MGRGVKEETEILYVLHRPDGSVFAELVMTPSMAELINKRRRKRKLMNGDWVPQVLKIYRLQNKHTQEFIGDPFTMSVDRVKLLNKAIPKLMAVRWVEVKNANQEKSNTSEFQTEFWHDLHDIARITGSIARRRQGISDATTPTN